MPLSHDFLNANENFNKYLVSLHQAFWNDLEKGITWIYY